MPKHILENEHLRVTVVDAGAELVSVYDRDRDRFAVLLASATD